MKLTIHRYVRIIRPAWVRPETAAASALAVAGYSANLIHDALMYVYVSRVSAFLRVQCVELNHAVLLSRDADFGLWCVRLIYRRIHEFGLVLERHYAIASHAPRLPGFVA